jgi:hypothetical protein
MSWPIATWFVLVLLLHIADRSKALSFETTIRPEPGTSYFRHDAWLLLMLGSIKNGFIYIYTQVFFISIISIINAYIYIWCVYMYGSYAKSSRNLVFFPASRWLSEGLSHGVLGCDLHSGSSGAMLNDVLMHIWLSKNRAVLVYSLRFLRPVHLPMQVRRLKPMGRGWAKNKKH